MAELEVASFFEVHIFLEGHKILRNLHQLFDWQYIGQIISGDFAKFCGLLRIYELYGQTLYLIGIKNKLFLDISRTDTMAL